MPTETKNRRLWVSSSSATAMVEVDPGGIIVWTAPIWKRFCGQPFENLRRWLNAPRIVDLYGLKPKSLSVNEGGE